MACIVSTCAKLGRILSLLKKDEEENMFGFGKVFSGLSMMLSVAVE
jgi:hypothetical protein